MHPSNCLHQSTPPQYTYLLTLVHQSPIRLFINPSIHSYPNPPIYPSTNPCIDPSIQLFTSICLPIHPSTQLSIGLSTHPPSTHQPIHPCTQLSIGLSVHPPSTHQPIHPSTPLFTGPSICPPHPPTNTLVHLLNCLKCSYQSTHTSTHS